ncbi:GlxA family transcriptional regulator [Rhizobium brockwellii]
MNRMQIKKRSVVFFMVPQFTMLPFSAAVDTLRIANRMLGYQAYTWRLTSVDGEKVYSSCGIGVEANSSLAEERRHLGGENRPGMVLVCSGIDVEQFNNKSVNAWLRECYNRGVAVGSLCTGAHVLAQAGLLNGKRCAIHWENLPGFSEAFPQAEVYADLYEIDGNLYTCAGGTASLDMMLNLVGEDFGESLVNRICEQHLTDRVRNPHDRQRLPLRARLGVQNAKVLSIIELMEGNLAEPLSLIDGNLYTCAGGTASLDMMLNLVGEDFGESLVNRICEQHLTDRVRNPHDRQRLPLRARLGVQNAKVLSIIELMEGNLAEPLSLIEIADGAGLSRRQIERLFRQEMGRSPARYYLEIRLDRARHLLVQSSMPVVEVAVACGFVSASHFSKCYRELYHRSPQQERAERKMTMATARQAVAA